MKGILAGECCGRDLGVVLALAAGAGAVLAGGGAARRLSGALAAVTLPWLVGKSVRRRGPGRAGPADVVTLVRSALAGCALAAALAPGAADRRRRTWAVAGVAIPALALDAVDGAVARATGTVSDAGARLDMETDAAVFLLVSAIATRTLTPWTIAIGAARYVFVGGSLLRPAWAAPLRPSRGRRVVAGLQGAALGVAVVPVIPHAVARRVVATAATLLLLSFGRDVADLERRAREAGAPARAAAVVGGVT